MRRLPLILISLLAVTSVVAADPLYKWVDEKGNVHYSDKPQPGAQKLYLPKASTFQPPQVSAPVPAPLPDTANVQRTAGPQPYTQIAVNSPQDQATIWNTDTVTVSVTLVPALQAGDTVTFSVDGKSQTVASTSATFTGLDRGEHDVTVAVNGQAGGGTVTAQSVFYIQRATVKKPPL